MSDITEHFDLSKNNTFKVSVKASYFTEVHTEDELLKVLSHTTHKDSPLLILGEGANILFTKNFNGLIIKNSLLGRKIIEETEKDVTLEIGAGENWHNFVMYSVVNRWSGIENLALIPGTVGAAPVQNVAAYGQNFGEVVVSVSGYNLDTINFELLTAKECKFFYRDSVFKHDLKDKFFITKVQIKLSKTPRFDTNYFGSKPYESLRSELEKINPNFPETPYTPQLVAEAVINQRKIKMPDWTVLGTAGSFFKNPFVSKQKYSELRATISQLQAYPVDHMLYPNPDDPIFQMSDMVKIPAGRLLDELGWKGKRIGNVGTFERHALVVVNYGGATGQEILEFTQKMQEDIKKNFAIELEPEVNIL